MNNFLKFIEEDIDAKKTLLSVMPTKNKGDKKAYNDKIDSFSKKYEEYRLAVRNYLAAKCKSYHVKEKESKKESLSKRLNDLERARFVLNPVNTFFEKLDFVNLLYELENYNVYDFRYINDIICAFIDKFDLIGVRLEPDDFNFTCYVKRYMKLFLENKDDDFKNFDQLKETFDEIYWENPQIIDHIRLNLLVLVMKYTNKFVRYVDKIKREVLSDNNITDYDDCLVELEKAYSAVYEADKESINDIINLGIGNSIDVNQFLETNKIRVAAYNSFFPDIEVLNDESRMKYIYASMETLKNTVLEYKDYLKFLPLLDYFKANYSKKISNVPYKPSNDYKTIALDIQSRWKKLIRMNKPLFRKMRHLGNNSTKGLDEFALMDSVRKADEINDLFKKYIDACFENQIMLVLNESMTIATVLNLYYSFDYFKKEMIAKVYNLTQYEEINKFSDEFDIFAMNPTNVIIKGIPLFRESNVSGIIANKYRMDGINLIEEDLEEGNIDSLLERIELVLRINTIENSSLTVDKVWFMVQADHLIKLETKTSE